MVLRNALNVAFAAVISSAVCAVFLPIGGLAQNTDPRPGKINGDYWSTLSEDEQTNLVVGIEQATLAESNVYYSEAPDLLTFTNGTFKSYRDGITKFYDTHPTCNNVPVFLAMAPLADTAPLSDEDVVKAGHCAGQGV